MAISAPERAFRLSGALSFGGALILGRIVQAVAFFFMAHRFSEEQMGALAILTVLFVGLYQLTNLGFDRYIVYERNTDPTAMKATIDTVWTMQLLRGVLIGVAIVPIGIIINRSPDFDVGFPEILGVAAAVMLLSLANPALSTFERGGDFNMIARARALAVSVGSALTIALVYPWPEPWVYVAGQIANASLFATLSFVYCTEWPRISLDFSRMQQVFRYSKHLLIVAVVSFISAQFQNIYIGAMFGSATLGLFFTWYRTVRLPAELLTQVIGRILYAQANSQARNERDFGRPHIIGFAISMAFVVPFCLFVWFHGDVLITVLAGDRWVSYWWAGRIMVLISLAYVILGTVGPFLLTTYPHVSSTLRTIEAVLTAGLMILLGPVYGVPGVLASMLAVTAVAALIRIVLLYRLILTRGHVQHVQRSICVLLATTLPLLIAELFIVPPLRSAAGELGIIALYGGIVLLLASLSVRYRTRLLRERH